MLEISIDDNTYYILYNINLDEAKFKIEEMINQQCEQLHSLGKNKTPIVPPYALFSQ